MTQAKSPPRYPKPRPIAIDFFCGAGGMSLGFEQAGFDVVLGVDVDGHHVATHDRNFPYGKTMCASIVNLDAKQIRAAIEIESDADIDVVVGGPPCQGFSHMGLRDLKDPRNSLIDHYMRLVVALRPKAFVMENVTGLLSGETRKILDAAVRLAQRSGYKVTLPVRVLDAAAFGVPQQRRRLFLLAVREDIGVEIPYPTGVSEGQPGRPTVLEALGDLPRVDENDALFSENDSPYEMKPRGIYAKVARGLLVDRSDLSRPRNWNSDICSGCLRTKHDPRTISLYAATPPGETVPGHKLPRLHSDGISPTLRAGSDSTHGSYTAPRPIHPIYPRCITSREAARLHGFPDWFALYPSKWHAYRQIGNAVCPPVARAIGHSIRSVLGGRTTTTAPASVRLGDRFALPETRPRTLKRIPQIGQFVPVIRFLVSKAYDEPHGKIRKATFTFADVQQAIAATGVNLHWSRPETFLSEIARSRRVNDMLAPALKLGLSILPESQGEIIGRFVAVGTPGTLEDKDSLNVRVDEIHDAGRISLPSFDLNGSGWGVIAILTQPAVQQRLWNRENCVVGLMGRSRVDRGGAVYTVSVRKGPRFTAEVTSVLTCKATAMPNKSRIARVGIETECNKVAVLVAATSRHLVALQFDDCLSHPRETARGAFEIL